jgi:secreted PhoX family phosphatase
MVFEGSTWICGGGRTPWNTWVSCEESPGGKVYQVDPFGEKNAQEMILGSDGGTWESFAYDIRDPMVPRFFVTEDNAKGALARYTPSNPDWNNTWDILHGAGTVQYLVLRPNQDGINGTFSWTANRSNAKQNAQLYYPHSEGIDVYGSQLFFVCKQIRMLFTLDLDGGTYKRSSTQSGLFDGGPDQLKRILNDDDGLLYFTEEGGKDSGIHARDNRGRFYTILESPELPGETTGLAFSPDSKFVYVAYQDVGMLYAVWRRDGFPFDSMVLDVKYHEGT